MGRVVVQAQLPRLESPPRVHISCGPCPAQWDILTAGMVGHPHSSPGLVEPLL